MRSPWAPWTSRLPRHLRASCAPAASVIRTAPCSGRSHDSRRGSSHGDPDLLAPLLAGLQCGGRYIDIASAVPLLWGDGSNTYVRLGAFERLLGRKLDRFRPATVIGGGGAGAEATPMAVAARVSRMVVRNIMTSSVIQ